MIKITAYSLIFASLFVSFGVNKINPKQQRQSICILSDKPEGWVVVGIDKTCLGCCGASPGSWGTSYTIEKVDHLPAGAQISVCIKDNLPSGWVVASITNCIGCCGARGAERIPVYTIKKL